LALSNSCIGSFSNVKIDFADCLNSSPCFYRGFLLDIIQKYGYDRKYLFNTRR
jgi:hypothetical protein